MYHKSWEHFIPKEEENDWKFKDGFDKYCERISKEMGTISECVLKQCFYKLYNYPGFAEEFGGINYYEVDFHLEEWTTEEILKILPPRYSGNYLNDRIESLRKLNGKIEDSSYGHLTELINYWHNHGTWMVPIIVIDSSEFKDSNYKLPYQLVEGHNRLSWIQYFSQYESDFKIAKTHKIWLIKRKKLNKLEMNEALNNFISLQRLIEEEQSVETIIRKTDNNITIIPLKDQTIDGNFLQITFRVVDEIVVLSWIYLLYPCRGTGTKIISWFIQYCKQNKYKTLKIANVEENNAKMRALCRKFKFIENKANSSYSDFYLTV